MKRLNNIIIILISFLLFSPSAFSAQELWTAWADQNLEESPIYLAHYQDAKWKRELFKNSSLFDECYMPCPGISPEGKLWLVWVGRRDGENPALFWSIRDTGEWTPPRKVVEDCNEWEYAPAIAFDPEGNPRLAWAQVYGESTEIFSAGWDGDGFAGPEMISTPDGTPDSDPAVAFGGNGEAIVVWQGVDNGRARIFESRLAEEEWTAEEAVDPETGIDQVRPAIRCQTGRNRVISWDQANRRVLLTGTRKGKLALRDSSPILFSKVNGPDSLHSIWMLRKTPEGNWEPYRVQPQPETLSRGGEKAELRSAVSEYYIGYGDSITYGHDSGGDTSRWYGTILKIMLEGARPGLTCSFYNKGYPGAYTSEMLYGGGAWGCPGINSILTDYSWATYILIMGGTNDIKSALSLSDISYNLGEMITQAKNTGVEPVLSTIIPRVSNDSYFTRSTNLSIDYIPPLSSSLNCLLSDPFSIFMQYYPTNYFWNELYGYGTAYWDGTHPYWMEGDHKIAEAWFDAFATPSPTPIPAPSWFDIKRPDGGERLVRGSTPTIYWLTDVWNGDVNLYLDRNSGSVYDSTIAIKTENDGQYNWTIPSGQELRTDYRVIIVSASDPSVLDISEADFEIWSGVTPIPPTPTPAILVIDSADYNGDGTSDISIFRAATGLWAIRDVSRAYFGSNEDIPVPADYNNDGSTDIGIFRPSSGLWAIRGITRLYYGSANDIPIPGDYTGTGQCEIGIFRKSTGLWALFNTTRAYSGNDQDQPIPGYYGWGRAKKIAIFRPSTGLWAIKDSSRIYFGNSTDIPAGAAYNGGGHSPVTIFRPDNGLWAVRNYYRFYFGGAGDTPSPGDFNGDGTDDVTIFRPSSGLWALRLNTRIYFGQDGDTPLAGRVPYPITPTPSPAPTATSSPSPTPSIVPAPSPTVSPSPSPTAI